MNNQEDQRISSLLSEGLKKTKSAEKNDMKNKVISLLNCLKNGSSNFNLLRSLSRQSAPKADLNEDLSENRVREKMNQRNSVSFIANRVMESYVEKTNSSVNLNTRNDLISPNSKGINKVFNSENESTNIEKHNSFNNFSPIKEDSGGLNEERKIETNVLPNNEVKKDLNKNTPASILINEFNIENKKEKEFLKRKRSKRANSNQKSEWKPVEILIIKHFIEENADSSTKDIAMQFPDKRPKQVTKQCKLVLAEKLKNTRKETLLKKQKTKTILEDKAYNNSSYNESSGNSDNWSLEEDNFLIEWVDQIGEKNWTKCAKLMKKRTAKQCKERFFEYLLHKKSQSERRRFTWTPIEELILLLIVKNYGTCWSKIIKSFSSQSNLHNNSDLTGENKHKENSSDLLSIRDPNEIKNKFYAIIKKFVHKDVQEKSQIYKEKKWKSHKINYDSDDSFTLQGKENANLNNTNNIKDNNIKEFYKDKDVKIKLESMWFYIDSAIIFYKNYFDEKTLKEILDYFARITNNFEGEVDKCIKEFNAKLSQYAGDSFNYIKVNLCECCNKFLRNHIKKKIILKYQQAKSLNPQIRHLGDLLGNNNENTSHKKCEEELDKKLKIVEKIPIIYRIIEEIKKGFALS